MSEEAQGDASLEPEIVSRQAASRRLGQVLLVMVAGQTALVMAQPQQPQPPYRPQTPVVRAPALTNDLQLIARASAANPARTFVGPLPEDAGHAVESAASSRTIHRARNDVPNSGFAFGPPSGPGYTGAALPLLPATGGPPAFSAPTPAVPDQVRPLPPAAPTAPPPLTRELLSSELPLGPGTPAPSQAEQDARSPGARLVSAEKPLFVATSTGRPVAARRPGDAVPVHFSTSAPAYLVVVSVNEAGQANTLFRSSAPLSSLSLTLPLPGPGRYHLVVLASVHPPRVDAVSDALTASSAGEALPAGLWRAAVSQAARSGLVENAARTWQRFQWAVAIESFRVGAPDAPAAAPARAAPEKREPPAAPPAPEPEPREDSVLPKA